MPPRIKSPGPVPQEALDFFAAKGLKIGFDYTDVWGEEHRAAFTCAKIMELDVLATMKTLIERAIEEGTTLEQFRKDVLPSLDKSGWSDYGKQGAKARLRVIYDTNMRMARATGQWQRVQRTKEALPYLEYGPTVSARPREEHQNWVGLVLPVDDPFWSYAYPPSAYGCKHTVRQVTRHEAEQLGGPGEAPPRDEVEWELPNGKRSTAPRGVHPSFNYPKGDRMKPLDDALKRAEER